MERCQSLNIRLIMSFHLAAISLVGLTLACAHAQRPAPEKCPYYHPDTIHAADPSRWSLATQPDSQLLVTNIGRIVVMPHFAATGAIADGAVGRLDRNGRTLTPIDQTGRIVLDAPPGDRRLIVYRIGLQPPVDTAHVRAGFADTVDVRLGDSPAVCLTDVRFTSAKPSS